MKYKRECEENQSIGLTKILRFPIVEVEKSWSDTHPFLSIKSGVKEEKINMDAKKLRKNERLAFLAIERLFREYNLSTGDETREGTELLDGLEKKLETGIGILNGEDFILLRESFEYYNNILQETVLEGQNIALELLDDN